MRGPMPTGSGRASIVFETGFGSVMSRLKVLYGFHAVTARLRADASTIEEVLYDPTRKDRRMTDFLRSAKEAGVRLIAADEALRIGLVQAVHDPVLDRALETVDKCSTDASPIGSAAPPEARY